MRAGPLYAAAIEFKMKASATLSISNFKPRATQEKQKAVTSRWVYVITGHQQYC